jgi:uncharacterized protein YpmB
MKIQAAQTNACKRIQKHADIGHAMQFKIFFTEKIYIAFAKLWRKNA